MIAIGYLNGKDTILVKRKVDGKIVEIPKLKFYSIEHEVEKLVGYDYNVLPWQVLKDLMGIGQTTKPKLSVDLVQDGEAWIDKNGVKQYRIKIASIEKITPDTTTQPQEEFEKDIKINYTTDA